MSPEQAVVLLAERLKLTDGQDEAFDSAHFQVERMVKLRRIFAHFFPAQVQSFPAVPIGDEATFVLSLLRLVNSNLFPINNYILDFHGELMMNLSYLVSYIPIVSLNYDWWNENPDGLPPLLKEILETSGIMTNDEGLGPYFGVSRVNIPKLTKICAGQQAPLGFLPNMLEVILHSTGNMWVDITVEQVEETQIEWTIPAVQKLSAEFKRAQPILRQYSMLDRWAAEDEKRIQQVVALLKQALEPERKMNGKRKALRKRGAER
jgi:hypothetical protein